MSSPEGKGMCLLEVDSSLESAHYLGGGDMVVVRVEVWGCGGEMAAESQKRMKEWEKKEIMRRRNVCGGVWGWGCVHKCVVCACVLCVGVGVHVCMHTHIHRQIHAYTTHLCLWVFCVWVCFVCGCECAYVCVLVSVGVCVYSVNQSPSLCTSLFPLYLLSSLLHLFCSPSSTHRLMNHRCKLFDGLMYMYMQ